MTSHPEEAALLATLRHHDELVMRYASGQLTFDDFLAQYDNFYWSHALDGHESNAQGLHVLHKHAARIQPHQRIADEVLARLVLVPATNSPGRIAPREAEQLLREIARTVAGGEA